MKYSFRNTTVIAALFAILTSFQASAIVRSNGIVIDLPSDLPEQAQGPADAMYLYEAGSARALLYLERNHGRALAILDVTDPGHIKGVGQLSIGATSTYDFVQKLGKSSALIQYRDQSGFAVINFTNYKQPVLAGRPDYLHSATVESYGPDGLVLVSTSGPTKRTQGPDYQLLTMSGSSAPVPIVTIHNVLQRVDLPELGAMFLLNDKGVTVIRRPSVERAHQTEEQNKPPTLQ
jgi:hypothetical protein